MKSTRFFRIYRANRENRSNRPNRPNGSFAIAYGKGRRTGMSDGAGQTAWTYDVDGNMLTEKRAIGGVTKSVSYAYNLNGSVNQTTYPSGLPIQTLMNAAGRISQVLCNTCVSGGGPHNFAYTPQYAPQGALSSVILGWVLYGYPNYFPGINSTYSYNTRLQPVEIKAVNSSTSTTLLDYTYSFVPSGSTVNNGTVMSIANNLATTRGQTYSYDPLNRLATAQSVATSGTDCWGQSFGYDRYANLTGISVTQCSAPTLSLSVNSNNNQIINTGYAYDPAGNVTADGESTYVWNAEGRMSSTAGFTYTYDGDGRRVEKSIGGHGRGDEDRNPDKGTHNANEKLYWYGVGGEVLAESDLSGNITSEYIYFSGQRIARRDPASGNVYYYLADRLGTARMMTDASGNVVSESDYYPYGGERVISDNMPPNADNTYKFTGDERDSESGLDHTLNRQYASMTGRWLAPDRMRGAAADAQSWNRYTYGANNPVKYFDPSGLCVIAGNEYADGGDACPDITSVTVTATPLEGAVLPGSDWVDGSGGGEFIGDDGSGFGGGCQNTGLYGWVGDPNCIQMARGLPPLTVPKPDPPLPPAATQVLGQVGQNTNDITSPSFVAAWFGASALAGGAGLASAGAALDSMLLGFATAVQALANDPKYVGIATDFFNGYTPTSPPLTPAGMIGAGVSTGWSEILSDWNQFLQNLEAINEKNP